MESRWRVKAYIEYEIDAENEEEAIKRLGESVVWDIEDTGDIREIAEVAAERISDND